MVECTDTQNIMSLLKSEKIDGESRSKAVVAITEMPAEGAGSGVTDYTIPGKKSKDHELSQLKTSYNNPRDNSKFRAPKPQVMSVKEVTSCTVTANMFPYKGKDLVLHNYSVTFIPEVMPKNIFSKFLHMAEINEFKEPYAFDGLSVLVSNKKFPDTTLTLKMKDSDLQCRIEYKHTHESKCTNGDSAGISQCVEIIARYYQKLQFLVDKKRMFDIGSKPFDLGCGLEIIQGLTATVKFIKAGIFLNLDMAFGVFIKPLPLIELLCQVAGDNGNKQRRNNVNPLKDDLGSNFYYDFEKLIKSVKVSTNHREKVSTFKVSGLSSQSASTLEFEIENKKWTVAQYFAETYKPLKYPHLPLVIIKKREMTIHLPFEVLEICNGQKYIRKIDENMTATMIKVAAKKPADRFGAIAQKANELSALENNLMKTFGMAFDHKMLNCKATILPPPQICFSNVNMRVNNGSWNLINAKALKGIEISKWTIYTFRSNDFIRDDSIDSFIGLGKKYGVNFTSRPQTVYIKNMQEFFKAEKSRFNLVILPDKSAQRYEEVKRIAETYSGVFTQCIVAANICKLTNPSFAANLLLKINAKLGGKNWGIDEKLFGDASTILFGIDVNHPGVTDLDSPSIVSVVASMDYDFINYKSIIEQQERRQEIVGSLKDSVKSLLKSHYASTQKKPQRIIVFRDGVGDSMFDAVYKCEIESIKLACLDLDKSYNPEINFLVAQKRHSTRFMCNGNNLVPGTIVDEVSTLGIFDFYLVSHHAIQGTARPVRYVVIKNDSNFTNMQLYKATYALCHLYARATKSVSIVPPIYYAHLGAARGKCYLEKNKDGVLNKSNETDAPITVTGLDLQTETPDVSIHNTLLLKLAPRQRLDLTAFVFGPSDNQYEHTREFIYPLAGAGHYGAYGGYGAGLGHGPLSPFGAGGYGGYLREVNPYEGRLDSVWTK
ncbi:protein argonaute-4-like [Arctopsyche grandis]|uniref:protein argonaute-4-like n=1 Tax=Arctopsyche grandis TaxID=121162 RepID=UPI00406D6C5F